MAQNGAQDIVAVCKNISADLDTLADGAFDGETAAVDLGQHVFDDNLSGVGRLDGAVFSDCDLPGRLWGIAFSGRHYWY
jgi:hypothetical protein